MLPNKTFSTFTEHQYTKKYINLYKCGKMEFPAVVVMIQFRDGCSKDAAAEEIGELLLALPLATVTSFESRFLPK
jgi:hypothetical protein